MLIDGMPSDGIVKATGLFSDTRQRYQESLGTNMDTMEAQETERRIKRNMWISIAGLGFATAGVLISPLFYWPSMVCILKVWWISVQRMYTILTEQRRLDFRFLWIITLIVTLAGGLIWETALGTIFVMISTYLVVKTESRSKQNIINLFGGQMRTAWLLVDGVEVETTIEQIQAQDIVVVHAGQQIPVDGTITTGSATIVQHMLTGEAQPAEKGVGDDVFSTTVVLAGRIYVQVEKAGTDTVAAQITYMLNQTNDYKRTMQSRTERLLNQMFLPLLGLSIAALPVAGVSGAAAVLWYYPGARMMSFGPLSMLSYLQIAAHRRILIKDGRALEALHEVDTVVFDKTGTLTLEQPTVSNIIRFHKQTAQEILRYAAIAESKQSHPIARAILQKATEQGLVLPTLDDAHYKIGYGLKVQVSDDRGYHTVWVGSFRFMSMEGIVIPPALIARQTESQIQGHSLILVALGDQTANTTSANVIGAIELRPTIRPEAKEIVDTLHARGIQTIIISGDHDTPTQQLATDLGIDRYFAQVLPEDKSALVTQLQDEGRKVCFVGDGINDSLALRTANVSVSLRGATTIATDMAQIVFMDGTLTQLTTLFTLTDEFTDNMRLNFIAAMIPGIFGITGTIFLGWGMTLSVWISQLNLPVGIYNALKPLVDERRNQDRNQDRMN
ncbi:MAG: heavy metal translocating P-type ATPase [Chloroflexota bacterium]